MRVSTEILLAQRMGEANEEAPLVTIRMVTIFRSIYDHPGRAYSRRRENPEPFRETIN
jgi:hypothetical protein